MQVDHLFSYTIIGDPGVGKSSLELQFTARTFPELMLALCMRWWFLRLTSLYFRRETFDHIGIWLSRARKLSRAGVTLVLIGNKCDLSHMRAVSYEEGRKFAKKHNLLFMEASAKTTHNVEEAFIMTAETIYTQVEDGVINVSEEAASLERDIVVFVVDITNAHRPMMGIHRRKASYDHLNRRNHHQRVPLVSKHGKWVAKMGA